MMFALSYFLDLFIGAHSASWEFIQPILHISGIISMVLILRREVDQIKFFGIKAYISSLWNLCDLCLILIYLGAFIPLNYMHTASESLLEAWHFEWKIINFMIVLLTFVKINQSLQIFDSFSFLVQMVQGVFYDLRIFLVYYLMVQTVFGFLLMILFKTPDDGSTGLDQLSYIIMSLRIVWGEGAFEIDKSNMKVTAWLTYILIMLVGNIVFMNFLIAVVNQSYEACMQRMQSQSLKSQLVMIRDHYFTLSDAEFNDP